ncbi:unnamed protein product [Lactuca saligna]|uniref:K Homology domain-containing protein n=1 Tax=Lactuca saligna TaxID=75948 RepID=A0AA36ES92_LACSI|nr:unnamed protein product [Lactuca saligna]
MFVFFKKMEPISVGDRYAKAKIEEPNLRLPKALLKPPTELSDDLSYLKIFEENTRKAQQLAEAVASGAKLDRKVYRIRNKELVKAIGEEYEIMKLIHRASKATIGLIADAETNLYSHSYLDLLGTVEEVQTAEELILDEILATYSSVSFPVILMPPTVYHDQMIIPAQKVVHIDGIYGSSYVRMEMESGAWIKVGKNPGGSGGEKLVNIFGPRENVIKAMWLIQSVICEEY